MDDSTHQGLLSALSIRRNVAVGLLVGFSIAGLVYTVRVLELLGPAPDQGSPALFFGLALVLGTTIAVLVAVVLSAASVYRLSRQPPEH